MPFPDSLEHALYIIYMLRREWDSTTWTNLQSNEYNNLHSHRSLATNIFFLAFSRRFSLFIQNVTITKYHLITNFMTMNFSELINIRKGIEILNLEGIDLLLFYLRLLYVQTKIKPKIQFHWYMETWKDVHVSYCFYYHST